MVARLESEDRNVLEERPNISFVEPKVIAVPYKSPKVELPSLSDAQEEVRQTKALANSVDVLATALQAKVNLKAKDMIIDLDPKVDVGVIQAMQRMYPDDDSTVITYAQYIACKDRLRERGSQLADQALQLNDSNAINKARKSAAGLSGAVNEAGIGSGASSNGPGGTISPYGTSSSLTPNGLNPVSGSPNPFYDDYEGAKKVALYGSKKARRGGLRPELDSQNVIIESLDIEAFQDCMIKILTNFTWKSFIRPILKKVLNGMIPFAGNALPKKITECPSGFKIKDLVAKGLPVLGEKKPKQQQPPKFDATETLKGT